MEPGTARYRDRSFSDSCRALNMWHGTTVQPRKLQELKGDHQVVEGLMATTYSMLAATCEGESNVRPGAPGESQKRLASGRQDVGGRVMSGIDRRGKLADLGC
jgi:hypothetical protein